jgi:hypothetical protein
MIRTEPDKLTNIDLSDLQIGEWLTIYRGSGAFLTGPKAAGYVGDALVTEIQRRSAIIQMPDINELRQGNDFSREYRLRFKDGRICRTPNGQATMLYVHARGGRPTVTAYFSGDEYVLVKGLLAEETATPKSPRTHRLALRALERMEFHEELASDARAQ